jgi:hypothetical protein
MRWARLAGCLVAVALSSGCDDDDDATFPTLMCNAISCDPVCAAFLRDPPDPVRSQCSPPGPICDFDLQGQSWEYTCAESGHILCVGGCPTGDLGVRPD